MQALNNIESGDNQMTAPFNYNYYYPFSQLNFQRLTRVYFSNITNSSN